MSCFTNWFDSPYYHILYKNRDEKEAQNFINKLTNYLKINKESKIIDIACGKGRHAMYFNQIGYNVVGIDLSKNSIEHAKTYENETLKFFIHDMRCVFKRNEFHIATNLFTSFGYFDNKKDNQRSINAMASNLKKNGILIIDFMNVNKIISNLILSEKKQIQNINFSITKKIENNFIIKNIVFHHKGKKNQFQEKVRAINLKEFSSLINKAKLKIINIFGSYNLEEFNLETSNRLILICKK